MNTIGDALPWVAFWIFMTVGSHSCFGSIESGDNAVVEIRLAEIAASDCGKNKEKIK